VLLSLSIDAPQPTQARALSSTGLRPISRITAEQSPCHTLSSKMAIHTAGVSSSSLSHMCGTVFATGIGGGVDPACVRAPHPAVVFLFVLLDLVPVQVRGHTTGHAGQGASGDIRRVPHVLEVTDGGHRHEHIGAILHQVDNGSLRLLLTRALIRRALLQGGAQRDEVKHGSEEEAPELRRLGELRDGLRVGGDQLVLRDKSGVIANDVEGVADGAEELDVLLHLRTRQALARDSVQDLLQLGHITHKLAHTHEGSGAADGISDGAIGLGARVLALRGDGGEDLEHTSKELVDLIAAVGLAEQLDEFLEVAHGCGSERACFLCVFFFDLGRSLSNSYIEGKKGDYNKRRYVSEE
jgi:hypothetical protein